MVAPIIDKKNTNLRDAIPPIQRLMAMENTFEDLKFISATIKSLKDYPNYVNSSGAILIRVLYSFQLFSKLKHVD